MRWIGSLDAAWFRRWTIRLGIAAYCKPENKVALGFFERLHNKIRVVRRRA